jgi:hypothetical protein
MRLTGQVWFPMPDRVFVIFRRIKALLTSAQHSQLQGDRHGKTAKGAKKAWRLSAESRTLQLPKVCGALPGRRYGCWVQRFHNFGFQLIFIFNA